MEIVCQSERLLARRWREDDADTLYAIYREPKFVEFLGVEPTPSLEVQRERIPGLLRTYERYGEGFGVWAMQRKEDGVVVGTIMLKHLPYNKEQLSEHIEIGWHLGVHHWGQGYATEMAEAMLAYGFKRQGCHEIHCVVEPGNDRSVAVAKRLGMTELERTTKYYDGLELHHLLLTKEAWSTSHTST